MLMHIDTTLLEALLDAERKLERAQRDECFSQTELDATIARIRLLENIYIEVLYPEGS